MARGAECEGCGKEERGAFILFEGVDRCGKTTQANQLVDNLKKAGHDACFMRFPGEQQLVGALRTEALALRASEDVCHAAA